MPENKRLIENFLTCDRKKDIKSHQNTINERRMELLVRVLKFKIV